MARRREQKDIRKAQKVFEEMDKKKNEESVPLFNEAGQELGRVPKALIQQARGNKYIESKTR